MATVKELAAACGVSVATISNVFTGKGRVSQAKREEVLRMAEQMNYVPNQLARSLKMQRSNTIGIIMEDLTAFNGPPIVDGIHECLERNGYTYILGNLRLHKKYGDRYISEELCSCAVSEMFISMKSRKVEGVIYIGAHKRHIHMLPENLGLPVVVIYGLTEREDVPNVNYDDEAGAREAVEYLISRGHRRIGLVQGDPDSIHTKARRRGYLRALEENGILFDPELVYQGDWSRESGYRGAEKLIPKGITALFCMNDVMAAGVYPYTATHGIPIGVKLSVIGFDDREIGMALGPELSTVRTPLKRMGESGAGIMLNMLRDPEYRPSDEELLIPCELLGRGSVCRI